MSRDVLPSVLEECLEHLRNGESLEQVLERYPQFQAELRPLLEAARYARDLGLSASAPRGAMARSRARMLAAAAQRRRSSFFHFPLHARVSPAILIAVGLILAGLVGTSIASAQALPGDPLYGLKLATERTRLQLTSNTAARIELLESYDRERAEEVEALSGHRRSIQVTFAGPLELTPAGGWTAAGIPLILPPGFPVKSEYQPGVYVLVSGSLQSDGSVLVEEMELRQIQFSGRVQSIGPDRWVVAGVAFLINSDTQITGAAQVGDLVTVTALRLAGDVLLARNLAVSQAVMPSASPTLQQPSATAGEEIEPSETPHPSSTPEQQVEKTRSPTQEGEDDHPTGTLQETEGAHSDFSATPSPSRTPDEDHEERTPTQGATLGTTPTATKTAEHDD